MNTSLPRVALIGFRGVGPASRLVAKKIEFAEEFENMGELLAHVAPLGWEHVAFTGDYG